MKRRFSLGFFSLLVVATLSQAGFTAEPKDAPFQVQIFKLSKTAQKGWASARIDRGPKSETFYAPKQALIDLTGEDFATMGDYDARKQRRVGIDIVLNANGKTKVRPVSCSNGTG